MSENEIANKVVGLAFKVHKVLGPGLFETAYKDVMHHELVLAGLKVEKEIPVPLVYEDLNLDLGFRADLLIENKLVLQINSVDAIESIHLSELLTYTRLGHYKLGILLNFNVVLLKEGIKRVKNTKLLVP